MKKIIFLFSICALVFSACKKDRKITNTGYLTLDNWYQKSAVASANINGQPFSFDLFETFPDCIKDDFRAFTKDGNVIKNDGATKCDEMDPQEVTEGKWMFLENETILQLPFLGKAVDMKIIQLDRENLVLQYEQNILGVSATITTAYYKRKIQPSTNLKRTVHFLNNTLNHT